MVYRLIFLFSSSRLLNLILSFLKFASITESFILYFFCCHFWVSFWIFCPPFYVSCPLFCLLYWVSVHFYVHHLHNLAYHFHCLGVHFRVHFGVHINVLTFYSIKMGNDYLVLVGIMWKYRMKKSRIMWNIYVFMTRIMWKVLSLQL